MSPLRYSIPAFAYSSGVVALVMFRSFLKLTRHRMCQSRFTPSTFMWAMSPNLSSAPWHWQQVVQRFTSHRANCDFCFSLFVFTGFVLLFGLFVALPMKEDVLVPVPVRDCFFDADIESATLTYLVRGKLTKMCVGTHLTPLWR